ncbi:hypothetical protein NQ314_012231 [Rhamnusium bicolor]|uniref:Uncharacterized protein n=1 Tax=Rhamnusium bicolor TaxID=1586634 RepID=A0AAV8XCF1_9CUCU|nr:hypothetical protein NQ314_012231 [Rhamnusium bicolor]
MVKANFIKKSKILKVSFNSGFEELSCSVGTYDVYLLHPFQNNNFCYMTIKWNGKRIYIYKRLNGISK